MDDQNRTIITRFREGGMGYQEIAEILGLKTSSVRSFCARNQIEVKAKERFCLVCHKPLTGSPLQKTCSAACRHELYQRRKHPHLEKVCPHCGKTFTARHKKQVYCCHDCYICHRFEVNHEAWGN